MTSAVGDAAAGTPPCCGPRSSGRTAAGSRARPPRRTGRSGPARRRSRSGRRPRARRARSRSSPSPTSPTGTTRPLRRSMRTASLTRSPPFAEARDDDGVGAGAVRSRPATASPASSGLERELGAELARRARGAAPAGSTPTTRQPAARSTWTVISPSRPEPDDDDALAERRLGAAHALERDRPERGERRVAQRDALGHRARRGSAGRTTTSAWFARPAPAQATRWPT